MPKFKKMIGFNIRKLMKDAEFNRNISIDFCRGSGQEVAREQQESYSLWNLNCG